MCPFSTERGKKVGHSEAPKRPRFPGWPWKGFQPSGSYPRATDKCGKVRAYDDSVSRGVQPTSETTKCAIGSGHMWDMGEKEAQRPLHETMCQAEARLVRHAPGGSVPS